MLFSSWYESQNKSSHSCQVKSDQPNYLVTVELIEGRWKIFIYDYDTSRLLVTSAKTFETRSEAKEVSYDMANAYAGKDFLGFEMLYPADNKISTVIVGTPQRVIDGRYVVDIDFLSGNFAGVTMEAYMRKSDFEKGGCDA
jgi:hypothetical protein